MDGKRTPSLSTSDKSKPHSSTKFSLSTFYKSKPASSTNESKPSSSTNESKPASSTKLCLICDCLPWSTGDEHYYAFILDPTKEIIDADGDGFTRKHPNIRFDGFSFIVFCVLNSTLYMFESTDFSDKIRKSVYILDLSGKSDLKCEKIEKSMVQRGPDMLGTKDCAEAIVTPDGKIMVFSHNISVQLFHHRVDFELYDPITKLWSKLPRLCPDLDFDIHHEIDSFYINSFGFLSDSLFFIGTTIGSYAFDFDQDCWRKYHLQIDYEPNGKFLLVANEFYLTHGDVKRRVDGLSICPHPQLSSFPPSLFEVKYVDTRVNIYSSIAILDIVADEEFNFCIAQTALDPNNQTPYITFDVCYNDLAKYRRSGKSAQPAQLSTTKVKSFKFIPLTEDKLFTFRDSALFRMEG